MLGRSYSIHQAIGGGLAIFAWAMGMFVSAAETAPEPAPPANGSEVALIYKFQPGQFVHYSVLSRVQYVTEANGNNLNTVQEKEEAKHFRVVSVDEDGAALLEPVLDRVKMSATIHENPPVTFDSTQDEMPPREFAPIKEMIGRPLARIQVSTSGKLLKVLPVVDPVPKALQDLIEKKDRTLNFLVVMPEKPIRVGGTWKEKYDTAVAVTRAGLKQQMTMHRHYELVSVVDGIATIKFRTRAEGVFNDPEIQRQIVQQTPSGTIEFDIERGLIREQSSAFNESVVNAFGPATALRAAGKSIEKLVPADKGVQQVGFTDGENEPSK